MLISYLALLPPGLKKIKHFSGYVASKISVIPDVVSFYYDFFNSIKIIIIFLHIFASLPLHLTKQGVLKRIRLCRNIILISESVSQK